MPLRYDVIRCWRGPQKDELIAGYQDETIAKEDCQLRNAENPNTEEYFYVVKPTLE
jgi:hypothetical protein